MYTHADKTREIKSEPIAKSLPKPHSNVKSAFQYVDNRPETIAQRKLQEAINNSQQVKQLRAYQRMADNFTSKPAHRYENLEEETLQGKLGRIQRKENNTGLPDNLKTGIENLSEMSMDDVKVYYNSPKPAQLSSLAYAQGNDIHVAPSQEKHLPHEAWHLVQQKQGRVKPTRQMKGGVNVNDDARLEKEADAMGAKALTSGIETQPIIAKSNSSKSGSNSNSVAQRLIVTKDIDTMDFIILSSIGSYLNTYGDQNIESIAKAHFKSLPPGEPVFIIGHGSAGSVEGMNAENLFEFLVTIGDLPKHCPFVYIAACQSGTNSYKGKSLAAELGELLHKNGYNATATVGFDGETAITDIFQGIERVTDPKKYDEDRENELILEMKNSAGGSLNKIIKNRGGDIKTRARFAVNHEHIRKFYEDLLKEDFFVKGTGMEFTPPPELVAFIKAFQKSKEAVLSSWLELSAHKKTYLDLMISGKVNLPIDLQKYGWNDLNEMIDELSRYERQYKSNVSLAMMYGWSQKTALQKAMED